MIRSVYMFISEICDISISQGAVVYGGAIISTLKEVGRYYCGSSLQHK